MKNILGKVNLRRGASLTLALLIFLLCALAGITALTMAMANFGRYSHADDDQQPYYTVSSAALFLVDLIDGTKYVSPTVAYDTVREWEHRPQGSVSSHPQFEYNKLNVLKDRYSVSEFTGSDTIERAKYYLDSDWCTGENANSIGVYEVDSSGKEVLSGSPLNTAKGEGSFDLLGKLAAYCDTLVPYLVVDDVWYQSVKFVDPDTNKEYDPGLKASYFQPQETLDLTFTISAPGFGQVTARLVMENSFDLILSFSMREQIGDEEYSFYSMNVYWEALVDLKTDSKQTEFEYTGSGDSGTQTTHQTRQVTVQWKQENVTISRGGAATTAPAEGEGGNP